MDLNFVTNKQNVQSTVFVGDDPKLKFKVEEDKLLKHPRQRKINRVYSYTGTTRNLLRPQTKLLQQPKFRETLNFKDFIHSDIKKNYQEQRPSPRPSVAPPMTKDKILESITLQKDKLKFRGYLARKDPLKTLKTEESLNESKEDKLEKQDRGDKIKQSTFRVQKPNQINQGPQFKVNKILNKQKTTSSKIEQLFQKTKKEIQFQNFLQNEQAYFDTLNSIQKVGIDEFQSQASIRQKYFYGQIIKPENQFCTSKDLITFDKTDIGPGKPFKYDSERDFKMQQVNMNHMEDKIEQYSNFSQQLKSTLNELKNKQIKERMENLSPEVRRLEKKFFDLVRVNAVEDVYYMMKENPYLVNAKDSKGLTPLMICAQRGYKELIQTLFAFNVNLEMVDENGKNAQQIAMKSNNPDTAQYINILFRNSLNKVKA